MKETIKEVSIRLVPYFEDETSAIIVFEHENADLSASLSLYF